MKDTEFELENESQVLVVGTFGAGLREWNHKKYGKLLWGYRGSENKRYGQGDVLVPFPSRIKNGQYNWNGSSHQLDINDKEGPNAIHGFLRNVHWLVKEVSKTAICFETHIRPDQFKGYPFQLKVRVRYVLKEEGWSTQFEVLNEGNSIAPFGIGFHPYFNLTEGNTSKIDSLELQIKAEGVLEFEKTLVPTGRILAIHESDLDFSELRPVGQTVINHCFTYLEKCTPSGGNEVLLKNAVNGLTMSMKMDPCFQYLVVYTGDPMGKPDARMAIAIEPMTCATDAFNKPDWGLKTLNAGETFSGQYEVTLSRQ